MFTIDDAHRNTQYSPHGTKLIEGSDTVGIRSDQGDFARTMSQHRLGGKFGNSGGFTHARLTDKRIHARCIQNCLCVYRQFFGQQAHTLAPGNTGIFAGPQMHQKIFDQRFVQSQPLEVFVQHTVFLRQTHLFWHRQRRQGIAARLNLP